MIELRLNGVKPPSAILANTLYHATFLLDGRSVTDVQWRLTTANQPDKVGAGPFAFTPLLAQPHSLYYSTYASGLVSDNTTVLNVSARMSVAEVFVSWDKIQYSPGETIKGTVVMRDSEGASPRSVQWRLLLNNVEVANGTTPKITYHSASFGIYRVIATVADYYGSVLQGENTVFVSGSFESSSAIQPTQPSPSAILLGSVYTDEAKGSAGNATSLPYQLAAYSQEIFLLPGTTHFAIDLDPNQNTVDDEVVVRTHLGNWTLRGLAGGLTTEKVGYDYQPAPVLNPAPFDQRLKLTVDAFNVHGATYSPFNFRVRIRCYRSHGAPIYRYEQCPYSIYPGGEGKRFRKFAALFSEVEVVLDAKTDLNRLSSTGTELLTTENVTTVPLVRLNTTGAPNPIPTGTGIFFTDTNFFATYESSKDDINDVTSRAVAGIDPYRPYLLSLQLPGLPVVSQTVKRLRGKLIVYMANGALGEGAIVYATVYTGKSPGSTTFSLTVKEVYNAEEDTFQKVGEIDIDLSDFQFNHTGILVKFTVQDSASAGYYSPAINYTQFGLWNVTKGTVDLIGSGATQTILDFAPGRGMYVDSAGTPGPGRLETKQTFNLSAGTYSLEYKAGNVYGSGSLAMVVSFGTYSGTIGMQSNSGMQQVQHTFVFDVPKTAQIAFESLNSVAFGYSTNPYAGILFDDVVLRRTSPGSVVLFEDNFNASTYYAVEPDPVVADQFVYSPFKYTALSFDGACFTNPTLEVLLDSENSAVRAVEIPDCSHPSCGPVGAYCYVSTYPPDETVIVSQPLYFPAPFIAFGSAPHRCYTLPALIEETTVGNTEPLIAYTTDGLCGTAYPYVTCDKTGTIAVVYPYATSSHPFIAYNSECYERQGAWSSPATPVVDTRAYTVVGAGSVAPTFFCSDASCTGADANGPSVCYKDNETGQKVNVTFDGLSLGIPRFAVARERIDTGFGTQPNGEIVARFERNPRARIMRTSGAGRIQFKVGLVGFRKKLVVVVNGSEQHYGMEAATSEVVINVLAGAEVYLDLGNEVGVLSARTRGQRTTVRWNPVILLPRCYDIATWAIFGSQTINAVGFCGLTNRQSYSLFDSLPHDGVASGLTNPDSIVTYTTAGVEHILMRLRVAGEPEPQLPGGAVWYAGQPFSGVGQFKFYTSRDYFGAHGEMDVWFSGAGAFPAYFAVNKFTVLARPAGFYRRTGQVGDTHRNSLRAITSPTGIMLPVIYTASDGEQISIVSNSPAVAYNGKTYVRS